MKNVLDVSGVNGRPARMREIREMAGRAMLDGPHDYKVAELEGPLLDLAVSKAEGLKAVIHLVDNAISPFFECCVLNECGRLQYQYMPSRDWTTGGPIIDREQMSLGSPGSRVHRLGGPNAGWGASGVWTAVTWHAGVDGKRSHAWHDSEPLVAAMRCYVISKLGAVVRM